ncbi:hypothetical protein KOW79_000937 [Hemibagrus wyckioides]|uniref:Uncharacterized protein n=1 Tax=Hemibagrus wyckioides TaxID=337641 RepID=A0A9D3SYN2_9TELE|nr:hypothetical protein KOW79_000937 [Hemibagrus wyckioides]
MWFASLRPASFNSELQHPLVHSSSASMWSSAQPTNSQPITTRDGRNSPLSSAYTIAPFVLPPQLSFPDLHSHPLPLTATLFPSVACAGWNPIL